MTTFFSYEQLNLEKVSGGVMFGTQFVPWNRVDQMVKRLSAESEAADRAVSGDPQPVVLPPVGGPPSAGDIDAYPDAIRRNAVPQDTLEAKASEKRAAQLGPRGITESQDPITAGGGHSTSVGHGTASEGKVVEDERNKALEARDKADKKHK